MDYFFVYVEGFFVSTMATVSLEEDERRLQEMLDRCPISARTREGLRKTGITTLSSLASASVETLTAVGVPGLSARPLKLMALQELSKYK
jgi:hypothetical protein